MKIKILKSVAVATMFCLSASASFAEDSKKNARAKVKASTETKNIKSDVDKLNAKYLNGSDFKLGDVVQQNKLTVINFWETWCAPCKVELPDFEKMYQKYKDKGVAFIGIEHLSPQKSVQPFIDELKVTFPTVYDEKGKFLEYFKVIGTPTTVVIHQNMEILRRVEGVDTALEKFIETQLSSAKK